MCLVKDKGKAFVALCFLAFIGIMSYMNAVLVIKPISKYVHGETVGFRQVTKTIAANYVSNNLKYKNRFINLNGLFIRLCGKRVHNDVICLRNNMLMRYDEWRYNKQILSTNAKKLVDFSRFLNEQNIPFMFVTAPCKAPITNNILPQGINDYPNRSIDFFINEISNYGLPTLDLRCYLSMTTEQVNKSFYRTDHHWNPDGAFTAFQVIMEEIRKHYKGLVIKQYTDIKLWKRHELKNWFLGSIGKRVGTLFAGTDSLIYFTPLFSTEMSLIVPHHSQIYKGDFVTANIRKEYIKERDFFNKNAYCVYIGGDFPLSQHRNINAPNKMRILLIKDSFMLPLEAFLSTEFTEVDVIDPRHYKVSSLAEYILWTRPDLVIQMNNVSTLFDDATNNSIFFDNYGVDQKIRIDNPMKGKELLKDYNAELTASKSQSHRNKRLPIPIQAGKTYTIQIKQIRTTYGKTDGVSLLLYDYKKKKIVRHEIIDIEYCEQKGIYRWTFKAPEKDSDYGLLVYSGIFGKTNNIGVKYSGIEVFETV